jgi:hypothetical protein
LEAEAGALPDFFQLASASGAILKIQNETRYILFKINSKSLKLDNITLKIALVLKFQHGFLEFQDH